MAKNILSFFGGGLILIGIAIMLFGAFGASKIEGIGGVAAIWTALGVGGSFLIAGAPFLGFARVIELLERIDRNTRAQLPSVRPAAVAIAAASGTERPTTTAASILLDTPELRDEFVRLPGSRHKGVRYAKRDNGRLLGETPHGIIEFLDYPEFVRWVDDNLLR